jgi:far upstream element-binding protein
VIGRGGATIKEIQNRTGARIQIPPQPDPGSNPPVRTVTITGVGEAGNQAKYEIECLLSQQAQVRAVIDAEREREREREIDR